MSQSIVEFVLYMKSFILESNSEHRAVNLMLPAWEAGRQTQQALSIMQKFALLQSLETVSLTKK